MCERRGARRTTTSALPLTASSAFIGRLIQQYNTTQSDSLVVVISPSQAQRTQLSFPHVLLPYVTRLDGPPGTLTNTLP